MAVCNIFKELTKPTGTFLTFSQYAESMTNTQQKVIPSKFVAINIHRDSLSNSSIPKILQNYYENGVAVIKNDTNSWNDNYSKDLFWRTMFNHFISLDDIKYIGDINIQSYEEYGGTGYTEIYCYIPNEAESLVYDGLADIPEDGLVYNRFANDYIEGYDNEDGLGSWVQLDDDINYTVTNFNAYDNVWCDNLNATNTRSEQSYIINTVVVLYDVIDKASNRILQTNQPMGIYFTGLYDEVNSEITNEVTKYVSSQEIYGAGTSYGLRICTKHIVSTTSSKINEFQIAQDSKSELSYALSQLSQSQTKMDEVISHTYDCVQNYKDLVAIFKNSKTNVPYIKLINGKEYWFVNGKRVGSAVIDDGELEHVCGINVDVQIYDDNDNIIKTISVNDLLQNKINLKFKWTIKNGDLLLSDKDINKIELKHPDNSVQIVDKTSSGYDYKVLPKYDSSNVYHQVYENYQFIVTLADGQIVTENVGYLITFPSYIGLTKLDSEGLKNYIMSGSGNNIYDNKLSGLLSPGNGLWYKTPDELTLEDQSYSYTYSNEGYDSPATPYHLCYIYPAVSTSNRFANITSYKPLTSIKDSRDLEYINDFEIVNRDGEKTVVMAFGSTKVAYNIYVDKYPAFVKNYTLSFK